MGKTIYAYDIEVLKNDWLVVARDVDRIKPPIRIHNDNLKLKRLLQRDNAVFGGFNNKHYDDGIVNAMYHGADNATVKEMNDFIIKEGQNYWDFPFMNHKRKNFLSFDVKDDLEDGTSLKSIEGSLSKDIIESSISFDIDRPLTESELEEMFRYCEYDVETTIDSYHERKSYFDSKRSVGQRAGLDEYKAMGMTNAKLTAEFLEAKLVKRNDEAEFPLPDTADVGKYMQLIEFYNDPIAHMSNVYQERADKSKSEKRKNDYLLKIKNLQKSRNIYECFLSIKIAGVTHKIGWGGIHGARSKYYDHADDKYNIVVIDAASLYPTLMIKYGYISRNIADPQLFIDVYNRRLEAKRNGDTVTSDDLKLILNTCYGAMKNRYNKLYDPRNANAVCAAGQIFITDLIDKIEVMDDITLIQSNTDGIIIKYPRDNEKELHKIVGRWEKRTGLTMEYTDVKVIAQKDVNNYIMRFGEVYLIEKGKKVVEKSDKNFILAIGGFAKKHAGGDFYNRSGVILHTALVQYLMNGVPVEETIYSETDMKSFQLISKVGFTFSGCQHQVDNKWIDVQKVNRVYPTTDKSYGTIRGSYSDGRTKKVGNIPEHLVIDNEMQLERDDIDLNYYIDTVNSRITDYVGKYFERPQRTEKENKTMTTKVKEKKTESVEVDAVAELEAIKDEALQVMAPTQLSEYAHLSLYQKLNLMRIEFQQSDIEKSGVNSYAEYDYFTLDDIVPMATMLFNKYNVGSLFNFSKEYASIKIINNDNPAQIDQIVSPMVDNPIKGTQPIQSLGSVQTYQRRYLYMALFDIIEADAIEETAGNPKMLDTPTEVKAEAAKKEVSKKKEPKKTTAEKKDEVKLTKTKTTRKKPATEKERAAAKDAIIDKDGEATAAQIKSIQNGLKKLRAKDEKYEDFIGKATKKAKAGITSDVANKMLVKIKSLLDE